MALSFLATRALVKGILASSNRTKQALGQRFAFLLGFEPGPLGPDDGVDGVIITSARKIHFQSKLSSAPLDKDEARKYYSDLKYHGADVSIMLAGSGYKATFRERLFGHPDIASTDIHLLTLADVIECNQSFSHVLAGVPELAGLNSVDWEEFKNP
jgi:hypothetical protein